MEGFRRASHNYYFNLWLMNRPPACVYEVGKQGFFLINWTERQIEAIAKSSLFKQIVQ